MKLKIWTGAVFLPLLVATITACVPVPKFKVDYKGIADLALRTPSTVDVPPYADATTLPRLPVLGPGADPASKDFEPNRPAYRLGPRDEVVVTVWGRADLGSQVPISLEGRLKSSAIREDGTLILPFLPPIPVAGRTIQEVQKTVEAEYAKIIEKPQVEVRLQTCWARTVEVGGEVLRPGRYPLCADRLTLDEVISAAGATTRDADLTRARLTREGKSYRLDWREGRRGETHATDILMRDGDVVTFPRVDERQVYVFGEALRQGTFPIPRQGMTLLQAMGLAYGVSQATYDISGVYLIRKQGEGEGKDLIVYRLKMSEILEGPEIHLANGDRVFIAASGLARWDRFWRSVLPFATIYRQTYTISY